MYGKKSVPMKPYYILQNYPTTRNVEAFFKKTAIAYYQNLALFPESRWHAIAVLF